jgi:ankyrin repeat protein
MDSGELIFFQAAINARNVCGHTALHDAVDAGHLSVARILVSSGSDVNAANRHGSTPLHLASLWGNPDCVELLVSILFHPTNFYHTAMQGKNFMKKL